MPANKYQMEMNKTKETKGTVVFAEVLEDPEERPHTFYILRDTYEDLGEPASLTVTLEA